MDSAQASGAVPFLHGCPVCTCPRSDLDQTDVSYPYRDTESVKAAVKAAQAEHIDANGEVKQGHHEAGEVKQGHQLNSISYTDIVLNIRIYRHQI